MAEPATAERTRRRGRIRAAGERLPLTRASDGRLAARVAAGDERAFEELVRRHGAALRGYCVQLLRRVEDAEDALQDALTSAHGALLREGPPREPRAWLFTIARNRCLSVLRARPPEPVELDEAAVRPTAAAAEVALSRADLRALVEDLGRLDPEVREALVLTRLGDFSHREVAVIVGCAPGRVRSLVRQARIELAAARLARERPCHEIRAELAELRRGGFRRAHIRRHLADCEPCRIFRGRLAAQEGALGLVLPVPAAAALQTLGRAADGVQGAGLACGGAAAAAPGGAASTAGGLAFGGVKVAGTLALSVALVGGGATIATGPAGSHDEAAVAGGDRAVGFRLLDQRGPAAGSRHGPGRPRAQSAQASPALDTDRAPAADAAGDDTGAPAALATDPERDNSLSRAGAPDPPAPEPDRGGGRIDSEGEDPGAGERPPEPPPETDTEPPPEPPPAPEPDDDDDGRPPAEPTP